MLEAVIESLEQQQRDNTKGAASALRALGRLAAVELPAHGIFASDSPELYKAIEEIADLHLGFAVPRRQFSNATDRVADASLREQIQVTANEAQSISDQAYFYAGIAFGITLARFGRTS